LIYLVQIAGILHLGLISAGALMPRVVGLRTYLTVLPPFVRQLFWVYYSFIGLCLVSFGILSVVLAPALVDGSNLARSVCGFLAAFWTLRLVAATFVLDVGPYLNNRWRRLGYWATNIAFVYLPIIYSLAAWQARAS
jgi:hypothetical protein